MEDLFLFLFRYIFIFLIYQIFIVNRAKKAQLKGNRNWNPMEVQYLVKRYRLDLKKISYNQLLQIIALVSSFDIAFIVSIILLLNNFWLKVFVGFTATLFIIFVSYHFIYLFYRKKGMICCE